MKPVLIAVAALAAAPAAAQTAVDDPLLKETVTIAAGAAYIPSYVG